MAAINECFNSTEVQLKDCHSVVRKFDQISFNSTEVQLKALVPRLPGKNQYWFQFHRGSINRTGPELNTTNSSSFNSTEVQLKACC